MESRQLLSTFVVTNTTDAPNPSANSLRWAILQVNAGTSLDTIQFDIHVNGQNPPEDVSSDGVYRKLISSKGQSECRLYLARCIRGRRDCARPSRVDYSRRHLKLRMIEHVKEFHSKQQGSSFRDREVLFERGIEVDLPRSA